MDVCILKTGKGLTRSLERLEDAKQNILPYMTAPSRTIWSSSWKRAPWR